MLADLLGSHDISNSLLRQSHLHQEQYLCSSHPPRHFQTFVIHTLRHLSTQRQLWLHRHDDSAAAMQTSESNMGPHCRHLLQSSYHRTHLVLCHCMLYHNRLCLRRYAVHHSVEVADEKKTQVHGCCNVESWIFVCGLTLLGGSG